MASNPARSGTSAAAIVAALFLPPLGVFLHSGMGREFWIATVLTVLFFVPGIVFALFTILRDRTALA